MPVINFLRYMIGIPSANLADLEYIVASVVLIIFITELFNLARKLIDFVWKGGNGQS
jgi:hypothetical protein